MTEIPWMDKMWQEIFANVVCVLVALGSVAAAGYSLVSGKAAEQGIDGLFLIIVCLVFAALFSILPAQSLRSGALAHLIKGNKPQPAAKEEPQAAAADKSQGQK
ncbi:MAG: hypothetical protein LAP21_27830 [Acidobacteriia bacterium]|nr:hypothetical protein [Terriglobia bacterium]